MNDFNSAESKTLLVNQEMLSVVNNVTIVQFCIRTITSANVEFNNVLRLISDNAAYMKKFFKDNLSGILSNTLHITCWTHILSLVAEEFRGALKLTDALVASVNHLYVELCFAKLL